MCTKPPQRNVNGQNWYCPGTRYTKSTQRGNYTVTGPLTKTYYVPPDSGPQVSGTGYWYAAGVCVTYYNEGTLGGGGTVNFQSSLAPLLTG
jgi:hypothetical protein